MSLRKGMLFVVPGMFSLLAWPPYLLSTGCVLCQHSTASHKSQSGWVAATRAPQSFSSTNRYVMTSRGTNRCCTPTTADKWWFRDSVSQARRCKVCGLICLTSYPWMPLSACNCITDITVSNGSNRGMNTCCIPETAETWWLDHRTSWRRPVKGAAWGL